MTILECMIMAALVVWFHSSSKEEGAKEERNKATDWTEVVTKDLMDRKERD